MGDDSPASAEPHPEHRTLTTRRGFIAAASLGAVSLYGLWAAYGAAPFPFFGSGGHDAGHGSAPEPKTETAGHGEHGPAHGPTSDEFRREVEEFIARNRQADGSVQVDPAVPHGASAPTAHADSGGHGQGHGTPAATTAAAITGPPDPAAVFLMAQQWSFEPALLRLRVNAPYRFRMMAVDSSHGASLQLGKGGLIIRLRRASLVERTLTFTRPGAYLVYCTVYCGIGHDRMSSTIIVA